MDAELDANEATGRGPGSASVIHRVHRDSLITTHANRRFGPIVVFIELRALVSPSRLRAAFQTRSRAGTVVGHAWELTPA